MVEGNGMKCQRCGDDNSEASEFCVKCGTRLPEVEEAESESAQPKAEAKRRKWLIPILAIAVAVVLISSTLVVYYSPDYSWSASIRDHDGDGVPDESDPSPHDAGIWAYGSATCILVVINNYNTSVTFYWTLRLLNESQKFTEVYWTPTVQSGEYTGVVKNLTWLVGETSSEWAVWVVWYIEGFGYGDTLYELGRHLVSDGQSYTFAVTFPDDFPAPLPL